MKKGSNNFNFRIKVENLRIKGKKQDGTNSNYKASCKIVLDGKELGRISLGNFKLIYSPNQEKWFLIAFYRDLVTQEEQEEKSVFKHTIHKFLMNYVAIQGNDLQKKVLDIVLKEYKSETEELEEDEYIEDDGYSFEEQEKSVFEPIDNIKEQNKEPEVDWESIDFD